MPTKLKNLVITKVALVDEGSCSAANIQLYKRKGEGGKVMDFEEILKGLPEEQREIVKAKMTAMEEAKKKEEEARLKAEADKKAAEDGKVAAESMMAKMKPVAVTAEEEVLKNLDPAVKAIIEKSKLQAQAAEDLVKKMKEDHDNAEAIAKAKEFSGLPVEEQKVVDLLKKCRATDLYGQVTEVLAAANAAVAKSAAFTSIGSAGEVDEVSKSKDAAWSVIEVKATEIAKAKSITKEAAISIAMTENPELYNNYLKTLV